MDFRRERMFRFFKQTAFLLSICNGVCPFWHLTTHALLLMVSFPSYAIADAFYSFVHKDIKAATVQYLISYLLKSI